MRYIYVVVILIIIIAVAIAYYIIKARLKSKKKIEQIQLSARNSILEFKKEADGFKNLQKDPPFMEKNLNKLFDQLTLLYNELASLKHVHNGNDLRIDIQRLTIMGKIKTIRRIINDFVKDVFLYLDQKYSCDTKYVNKYVKLKNDLIDTEFDINNCKKKDAYHKLAKMAYEFKNMLEDLCDEIEDRYPHNVDGHALLRDNMDIAKDYNHYIKNLEFDLYSYSDEDKKTIYRMLIDAYREHDKGIKTALCNFNTFETD